MSNIKDFIQNKDLIRRFAFTFAILLVFRIGSSIPVPGVNTEIISEAVHGSSVLMMMNMFGGGSLQNFSLFAMGITPYITAGIVIQALSNDVIPVLSNYAKSGEIGKRKLEKITRYLGLILATIQAYSLTYGFDQQYAMLVNPSRSSYIFTTVILTAGYMGLLWISDKISRHGIGNGLSLIIFSGVVASIPSTFGKAWTAAVTGTADRAAIGDGWFALFTVMYLAIILLVMIMETSYRKISVSYSNEAFTTDAGDVSYIPIKINSASVIPVIFANAVISMITMAASFASSEVYSKISMFLSMESISGLIVFSILVIMFTFLYTNMQLDSEQIAENLAKSGAYINGIRPGEETERYLHLVINRVTVAGALALVFLSVLPYILTTWTRVPSGNAIGGTGMIIVVGVALETISSIKAMMKPRKLRSLSGN